MKRNPNALHENKPQRWRAIVVFKDNKEGLLRLGSSFAQVTETYDDPWFNLYDDEERKNVKAIFLQKWVGLPDSGRWNNQRSLEIPADPILNIGVKGE